MTKSLNKTLSAAIILALGALFALSTNTFAKKPNDDGNHKVTICHRTNSVTNPYVQIEVDEDSVDGDSSNDNGQGDHLSEHIGPVFDAQNPPPPPHNGDQWGDIIPPFYTDGTSSGLPSLNWPDGQSFFFNNCEIPTSDDDVDDDPTPTDTPTDTPTPTPDDEVNDEDVDPTPTDTPTPTPTVTQDVSPTETPTPTPTASSGTGGTGGSTNSTSSDSTTESEPQVQATTAVLGASTFAGTGVFEQTIMNLMGITGMLSLALGAKRYAKEKKA